ncbi:MAG: sortase and related acyltransferase [Fibrobacteres bacterium]|nr:sortase and related acyltransferase [Fibrobacterota bacterium]
MEPRLGSLTQTEFTVAGRLLLAELWDAGQEKYESFWLGPAAPPRAKGELHLFGWITGSGIRARLAVYNPSAGDCLFMLYARAADAAPAEIAAFLLAVKADCKSRGMGSLTGPMQFSTWHPYRFISKMGRLPYFPGEQRIPTAYHGDFLAAGFSDLAEYQSIHVRGYVKAWLIGMALGVKRGLQGMEVKTFGSEDMLAMLPELYRLSCDIFKDNFLYEHIAYGDFLELSSVSASSEAVLIMLLRNGTPAAFAYSYGIGRYPTASSGRTAVLKTLGVAPAFRGRGLGYSVSYLTHLHWKERGARNVIHAYMKSDNRSRAMSGHFGKSIRSYVLMKGSL